MISQLNPFDINPLRDRVIQCVDLDVVNPADGPRLLLSATKVRTGQPKVGRQPRITANAVMAAACLFPSATAVEIDGEPHWDVGYTGNPPFAPLTAETVEDWVKTTSPQIDRSTTWPSREIFGESPKPAYLGEGAARRTAP